MENWTQIRQMYYNQQMSIRQIAKTLGLNRRTVKRAISTRGGPRYNRQAPYPSMLDPFKPEIEQMLKQTNGKIPATVIYSKLSQREDTVHTPQYHGSYETLWRYVREWIQILRLSETYPMNRLVDAVKEALAYGVCDYASIKNFVIQSITPQVAIEKKNCLFNQPQLAHLVVEPRALSGYDVLLEGGQGNDR